MAEFDLTSWAGLKVAVAGFLNRTDLTDAVPAFITLAESQMRRRFAGKATKGEDIPRRLVVRASAALPAGEEFLTVPARFAGPRTLKLVTDPVTELAYLSEPDFLDAQVNRTFEAGAAPAYYTVVGQQMQMLPIPAIDYSAEMSFLQGPEPLGASNATNWLLQDHPDLYLYGALTAAAPYLIDDDRVGTWGSLFTQGIEDACSADPLPKNQAKRRVIDFPTGLGRRRTNY